MKICVRSYKKMCEESFVLSVFSHHNCKSQLKRTMPLDQTKRWSWCKSPIQYNDYRVTLYHQSQTNRWWCVQRDLCLPMNWFVLHTGDSLTSPTSDHQDKYTTHFWILDKTETWLLTSRKCSAATKQRHRQQCSSSSSGLDTTLEVAQELLPSLNQQISD